MQNLSELLTATAQTPPLEADAPAVAELSALADMDVYARSVVAADGIVYAIARKDVDKCLVVLGASLDSCADIEGDDSAVAVGETAATLRKAPFSAANAAALRKRFDWCVAQNAGVRPTMGCGDRLGIATPAHIQAVRGTGVFPVLAQQSIREMERTGRTPQDVMDNAIFGVFEEGWRDGFGSDADHLKTTENIDRCAAAGFTMYTVDPGDHVDNDAETDEKDVLLTKLEDLPWQVLDTTAEEWMAAYSSKSFDMGEEVVITFDELALLRAAAKYGRAIAHTKVMYKHLQDTMGDRPWELEMSVDETISPTTPEEHYFVAAELHRLGVELVSLAPRFIGEFEKGVDYRGCLAEFKHAFKRHTAIAREFGGYKISLHSGSDKFTIYPIASEVAGDMVHLKTAGTSYLEAVRSIAVVDPALFREILTFAHERYDADRATYHVSAERDQVPMPDDLSDEELPAVLDPDPGRQLLHVTYGSVLTEMKDGKPLFKDRLMTALKRHEDVHYEILSAHIRKHVEPIAR